MIFQKSKNVIESEKERNLYTKFFAGYYFNELVDGYDERIEALNEYLSGLADEKIVLKRPYVSFDNHAYLFDCDEDRGEFADILIHDQKNKLMVAIEAKYLSDWSAEKDFKTNLKRINKIRAILDDYRIYFVLLVTERKWKNVKKRKAEGVSNYKKYIEQYKDKVIVAHWDKLKEFCQDDIVKQYMESVLRRTKR